MARQMPSRSTRGRASPRHQPKRGRQADADVPDVYQELLEEAEARDPEHFALDRPVKRRKIGDLKAIPVDSQHSGQPSRHTEASEDAPPQVQTVYDSSESEDSDVEWEDVGISQPQAFLQGPSVPKDDDGMLQITLEQEPEKRQKAIQRRKPLTGAERRVRLDVHKSHLLCLLGHVHLRNLWCNDDELQDFVKKMLPKKVITLLHPDEHKPHYIRSTTFMDGLNQAGDAFARRFRVTKPGMKRSHWAEDETRLKEKLASVISGAEVFLSRADFRAQAKTMQGSRDFGAQLFCALLRAVAIEARLVCSLQPLPFSGTVKDMTPSKPKPQPIIISSDEPGSSTDEQLGPKKSPTTPRTRRIGQPKFAPSRPPKPQSHSAPYQTSNDSPFPVFWVEAFNEAAKKWIPIDPVVTKSLAKPTKFEPPASDPVNLMNYVVGFEDDASARDITRRYVKAFNAKTRKLRVESTRHGQEWWDNALKAYEKPFFGDRDEAEISELTSKAAAEPMPRSIQDFKDHPVYALERQVRRNEVIHPKRVIGHVGLGKSTTRSEKSEPVYRRADVHVVRSSDKWYRLGRDVKVGEQPLKRVPAIRGQGRGMSDDEDDEPAETTLYAESQTQVYVPPPVVNGRIPKNAFGNLDIYVPSMVPPGGVHIKRPEAVKAARILGIDYADAVTGFDFKGRRGTAVVRGIVVALEYQEAIEDVIEGLEDERRLAAIEARSQEALQFWRLFLVKLRIAERVNGYADDDEEKEVEEIEEEMDVEESGGGFFPEADGPTPYSPPPRTSDKGKLAQGRESSGFDSETGPLSDDNDDDIGGGFFPEDDMEEQSVQTATEPPEAVNSVAAPSTINQSPSKAKRPQKQQYSLVVVPSNPSSSGPQGRRFTSEKPSQVEMPGSSENAPISVTSSTNGGSKSASVVTISRPPTPIQDRKQPSAPNHDSDSEIDKGSLLSEDPDDEDAIPEWLMSDED
ncbi:unnamed protein product [Penicillium salamii]|nr:unnamed protein product [Penicillium salamii]CAG8328709.1 unnamed protein product [Penicillium salamii]